MVHTLHAAPHFNICSNSFLCFLFIYLTLYDSLTGTLFRHLEISEYRALEFLFFAGWVNDMVVKLTVIIVKQHIFLPFRPYCVFVWQDGVCFVIWTTSIIPQSHCHHPYPHIADEEQYFHLISSNSKCLSRLTEKAFCLCFFTIF